jgi:hypothetical protein
MRTLVLFFLLPLPPPLRLKEFSYTKVITKSQLETEGDLIKSLKLPFCAALFCLSLLGELRLPQNTLSLFCLLNAEKLLHSICIPLTCVTFWKLCPYGTGAIIGFIRFV